MVSQTHTIVTRNGSKTTGNSENQPKITLPSAVHFDAALKTLINPCFLCVFFLKKSEKSACLGAKTSVGYEYKMIKRKDKNYE